MKYLSMILRLIAAVILLQTLFFKFSGAEESKFIFSTLGVEPWGRWFAGFSELVTCVLLLLPKTKVLGAVGAIGIMFGAIMSHLFILGLVVQDDGGLLFSLACTVTVASMGVLILERAQLKAYLQILNPFLPIRKAT